MSGLDNAAHEYRSRMIPNAFDPEFHELPTSLPIFPLTGALVLPGQQLPLNIFEPRYLEMVFDALGADRMIGMVQALPDAAGSDPPAIFEVGCAARISMFNETDDGRLLISLRGVCRFRVERELDSMRAYRRVQPIWEGFEADLGTTEPPGIAFPALRVLVEGHLRAKGLEVRWDQLERLPADEVLDFLCVNLPFEPGEKQALLEAPTPADRADVLKAIVQLDAAHGESGSDARH